MKSGLRISKSERNYRIKYALVISIVGLSILTGLWILYNNKIINTYIFIFVGFALAIVGGIVAARVSAKAAGKFQQFSEISFRKRAFGIKGYGFFPHGVLLHRMLFLAP